MFTTPAILTKYNPRKDKSVTISFETDEKSAEQVAELHGLISQYGALVFKPENQLTPQEIKEIDDLDIEMTGKTKSQRLRNVIYRLHEQEGGVNFNLFYAQKMEEIINHIKSKLE